ncbi:methylenetetrahydrofolate reductase [Rubrobacter aplysinae]|uniref:methylenetetrahydrofolate reductase n=1 Tax=Rubrobacter aplysinae TaxID=909625 RepID=UPI00069D0EC0|nr:methylenetetrahydrofolate reductase [Rubrobacter aplysinae]
MIYDRDAKEVPIRVAGTMPGVVPAMADPRFEIIPIAGAENEAWKLPRGAQITVTCSPTLGQENTLELSERLAQSGFRVVPHLSARLVQSREHLQNILHRLDAAGMQEIFVVGGDAREPVGPFYSAATLLHEMSGLDHGVERIGVTAYPESHPLIGDEELVEALREKQQFAHYAVTQICFDSSVVASWLSGLRERGVELPVYVGLPGAVERKKLLSISMKIGVGDSARFLKKQAGLATRLVKPGGYRPDELVESLAPYFGDTYYGLAGFHINTFNQAESTESWRWEMLDILESEWLNPEAGASESPA